ncbi:hypothetical protein AEM42_05750 [Betaproteobacteria bacterium UKL13-2]|jgi:predicted DNA-binding transcriptional regulator YafY|nr:hypothetical protein AEM42_05750 [Betaproteobacteria bacterium UKL13-2]HCG51999.1 transcriptional regulator [Betaproteobacteria bacterium]
MERLHRKYTLHQLLRSRRYPISLREIMRELGVSEATVRRLVGTLRAIGAPIENDKDGRGYYYEQGGNFELPGVWLTHKELLGIITAHELLGNAEPSLIGDALSPIWNKIEALLEQQQLGSGELTKRVRIIRSHGRGLGNSFNKVIQALVERKRLYFTYRGRGKRDEDVKIVSAQRIAHYRDNWFLDAYCHHAKQMRTYSIDRIRSAEVRNASAHEIDADTLDNTYKPSYGIFSGTPKATAVIAFDDHAQEWALDEKWHSEQTTGVLADGRHYLSVPYSHDAELLQDILKYGPGAEVISPPELRKKIAAKLNAASQIYAIPPNTAPDKAFGGSRK